MGSISDRSKISIIGTNGLPGRYGGWDQLMNHLTKALADKVQFVVYTSSYDAVKGMKQFNGADLFVLPLKANGIQSVLYDGISILISMFKHDTLLILGTSGCIFLPFAKMLSNKKVILNIDGAEWKRGKWNLPIQKFLKYSEYLGVKYADIVISDNEVITEYVLEAYGKESKLIPYGGDHALQVPLSLESQEKYGLEDKSYAFKVCRIEPENNIDMILCAFSKSKMKLVLVGNWKNSQYGIKTREKYSDCENLLLLDAIYDQEALDELRSNCKLYVHGHSVGGTNPSLVEAMSLGLCCVVFDVNYNRVTTQNKAVYFDSEEQLAEVLDQALNSKIDCDVVGQKMAGLAKVRYTWDVVVSQYAELIS